MLTRTTGTLYSLPWTITKRPFLSATTFKDMNYTFYPIKIAILRHFESSLEWKTCDTHPLCNLETSGMRECVSCRNITTALIFIKWENTPLCLTGWLSPLTFQLTNFVAVLLISSKGAVVEGKLRNGHIY